MSFDFDIGCALLNLAGLVPARRIEWDMALERSSRLVRDGRIPGLEHFRIVIG